VATKIINAKAEQMTTTVIAMINGVTHFGKPAVKTFDLNGRNAFAIEKHLEAISLFWADLMIMRLNVRILSQQRRSCFHLRTLATKSTKWVRWSDDFVAESAFPPCDASIAENLRFTEFVTKDFQSFGEKLAILDGVTGMKRSFADLLKDIESVGTCLKREYDLGVGSRIALFTPNHVDFFATLHGSAKLGAIVTPVNPAYQVAEVARQLIASDSTVLVAHPDTMKIARLAVEEKNKVNPSNPCKVISIDDEIADFRSEVVREPLPQTPVGPDATLYLPYSSGTTGTSKGVELTHSNLIYNVLQSFDVECKFFDPNQDVIISPLPMFHIYGFLVSLHNPIHCGCTMVTMKKFDIERFCQLIEEYKCTRMHVVPPIILQISKSPLIEQYDLNTLKMGNSAAAPLGPETEAAAREKVGCEIKQLWGMSELSPLGTGVPDDGLKQAAGSVGPPVASTFAKIVDVTSGRNLPPGEEGELCIKGPQVMKGYLDAPEKTAECLNEDGWLKTGDIAKMDEDGYVYITDRLKELIKYKGFPVAPAELETVILMHPAVFDVCVIPRLDEGSGELPRAYVVLQPDYKDRNEEELKKSICEFVDEAVAQYKRLRGGIIFTDKIPKTESGKLLRRILIDMDRQN